MNARLAAGLASLPPPPHSHNDSPSRSGGGGDSHGGNSLEDCSGGSGSRKRQRQQQPDDDCHLRGGGGADAATASDRHTADVHADGNDSDADSGPPLSTRPVKVQRIAVGMSTTDLPAAAAREEDEGTSTRSCVLVRGSQIQIVHVKVLLHPTMIAYLPHSVCCQADHTTAGD